jgi:hypothetical protein
MQPGVGFDLQGLEQGHGQTGGAQIGDHAAFVAAGGFEADAIDAGLGEFVGQPPPARAAVFHGEADGQFMDRQIEFIFGDIDAGGACGMN